ncbi:MAG: hypothetical protein IT381_28760 [Deltaproteobacteria bacterium]|nr:hypothetical protein [Deltaproteobacteria bacterium]
MSGGSALAHGFGVAVGCARADNGDMHVKPAKPAPAVHTTEAPSKLAIPTSGGKARPGDVYVNILSISAAEDKRAKAVLREREGDGVFQGYISVSDMNALIAEHIVVNRADVTPDDITSPPATFPAKAVLSTKGAMVSERHRALDTTGAKIVARMPSGMADGITYGRNQMLATIPNKDAWLALAGAPWIVGLRPFDKTTDIDPMV